MTIHEIQFDIDSKGVVSIDIMETSEEISEVWMGQAGDVAK